MASRYWKVWAGLLLQAALLEPAAGQGTSLGADEQAALVLAEKLYPTLLTQGGALGSAQGYVYRYYAGSGVYVGFRNQRIYLLGGPFGNVAQDKGTVAPPGNRCISVRRCCWMSACVTS